ncbi:MAG: hypothetical protein HRU41_05090 [Saprospiraceae bacterium]|nr:hypothetical protein [Saprospiraceae bacterium]
MASAKPFDLRIEVDTYVSRLGDNFLLNSEESNELRDHFHCQVEELAKLGLSDKEAFEVSKMRFGKQSIVREEYKKIKPFGELSRYLIVAILLLFFTRIVINSFHFLSSVSLMCTLEFNIHTALLRYFDLGLKTLFVAWATWIIFRHLKRQKLNKVLLFSIPFLSLFSEVFFLTVGTFLFERYNGTGSGVYRQLFDNSSYLILCYYLFLIVLFVLLWRKEKYLNYNLRTT